MKIKFILLFIFIISCKTQEDIKRDQLVDTMATQVNQSQKLSAQYTSKALEMEEKFTKMIGALDDREHQNFQTTSRELIATKIALEELRKDIDLVKSQMIEQKEYLDKILASLSKMGETPSKKKSKKSDYEEAVTLYNKGDIKESTPLLLALSEDKKLKSNQKARVIYYLGMIAYKNKKYSDAVTLFSRLYTQHPESNHNISGLLHLGRSFLWIHKKEEGKQVLQELIDKYPKAANASIAAKILKELGP